MDMVLKVTMSLKPFGFRTKLAVYTLISSEYISYTRPFLQSYQYIQSSLYQSHEEFCLGNFLRRPCNDLPTRVRVHTPAGYSLTKQHES